MTEKIAWLEEVLGLEPNSKLFFPLALAYVQNSRNDDAVAVLRKGLTFHPEHLEARLLLIECLAHTSDAPHLDQARLTASELEPLTLKLAAYPAFWKEWATRCRDRGQTEMALTLDMLAGLLSGTSLTWGAVLEQGLRALITQSEQPQALAHAAPASTEASLPAPPASQEVSHNKYPEGFQDHDTPWASKSPEMPSPDFSEPAREPEIKDESREDERPKSELDAHVDAELNTDEDSSKERKSEPDLEPEPDAQLMSPFAQDSDEDTHEPDSPSGSSPLSDAQPASISGDLPDASGSFEVVSSEPEVVFSAPSELDDVEIQLTEGERRYYETKTYADLLAKQGEHEEALSLYTKLLQTSPDEDKHRDLQTRIHELQERIAKNPKDIGPEETPLQEDPGEATLEDIEAVTIERFSGFSSRSTNTTQTLIKLAERLESRAAK